MRMPRAAFVLLSLVSALSARAEFDLRRIPASGDVQAIDRYLKVIERRTALAALILGAEPVVEDENVRTPLDELNARRAARGSTTAGKGVPKVAAKRG